jgi:hypothetical protein
MKPTTEVVAKFESKGKPKHNEEFEGTIKSLALAIANWLLRVDMGHKLQITIARDKDQLNASAGRGHELDEDILNLLDQLNVEESY